MKILKHAILHAALTVLYITCIASVLTYVEKVFEAPQSKTVLGPILMLSLLVFSVAMVGSLIFGKPILWYWDGKKKEAVLLLIYTLLSFFVCILLLVGLFIII
jgi:hypothetical protein